MAATHVNHMQKALDQMNLQVHHVISDIVGQTGLAIVDARPHRDGGNKEPAPQSRPSSSADAIRCSAKTLRKCQIEILLPRYEDPTVGL